MCNCRCKQGEQGETGAAGPSFSILSHTITGDTVNTTKTITITASAPSSGTLTFWANVSLSITTETTISITPNVNAVALTAFNSRMSIEDSEYGTISFSGQTTIVAGQSFTFTVAVPTGTCTILTGCVLYSIT